MSRFQVGPLLRGVPVSVVDHLPAPWDGEAYTVRPLPDGARPLAVRDTHVPEQLSTDDPAVAAWVSDKASLRDPERAFAVIRRAPDVDSFPARGAPFDTAAANAAIRDLRDGKAVQTSVVVRIACHVLETT